MLELTNKQALVSQAILDGKEEILFGGAVSSAKSFGMGLIFISLAIQYPNSRFAIFRKNYPTLKATTYVSFRKASDAMNANSMYTINKTSLTWSFKNGSEIMFMQADVSHDEDFNKLKGLELSACGIDEGNELVRGAYETLLARIGRHNKNGCPDFILMTCNPTDNWVKEDFYDPQENNTILDNKIFIQALPEDNPHNSERYLERLRRNPVAWVERYYKGNWNYKDDSTSIFKFEYFKNIVDEYSPDGLVLGVDVAREGKDRSFACVMGANTIVDFIQIDNNNLNVLADRIIEIAQEYRIPPFRIAYDAVGVGAGLGDILEPRIGACVAFKAGAKPNDTNYDMLRSESFYKLSQAMQQKQVAFWSGCNFMSELEKELSAHNIDVTPAKVKVTPKTKIKELLSVSPDIADSLCIAYSLFLKTNSATVDWDSMI